MQRAASTGPVRPAVQRLSAADPMPRTTPLTGGPRVIPQAAPRPSAVPLPVVVQRNALDAPKAPSSAPRNATTTAGAPIPVQRDPKNPLLPTPATTTAAVSAVTAHRTASDGSSASDSTSGDRAGEPPPAYTAVAKGGFDPRSLTDFQLDELTHKLIGRITRLIRTELRLDRERIGKLRDPRR
ncbi:extensin [Streptomyces sp. NPDC001820]|uniref:extensin n=1 Tax=Streptomyces sp. NPDC001820 TaxID=3364613 RepID=UPI0036B5E07C